MIGRVFAQRYRLEEFVGKGGMALVFRATDLRTGHDVAVKVLRPEFNSDAEFLERFQREALAASKMSHHNIVNLLDVGEEDILRGMKLLMMEGKLLCEPSSAIGIGAALAGLVPAGPGDRVCFVISGGNVALEQLRMLEKAGS